MNNSIQQETAQSSDQLFLKIFGTDQEQEAAKVQEEKPKFKKSEPKTFATFSQLMTLAHAVNRRHGKAVTPGCNCFSCKGKQR